MDDNLPVITPIPRTAKPWQWWCLVLLTGICCGVSGLYIGSYITGSSMSKQMDTQRIEFETSTKNEVAAHAAEFNGVNANTVAIAKSVAALATAVSTLTGEVNAISVRLGTVAATADKHSEEIQQIHKTAKVALKRAVVADAKTDAFEAKVDAASATGGVLPKTTSKQTTKRSLRN